MPFNKETAAAHGSKGGSVRKKPDAVRNKQLKVVVSQAEYDIITVKAAAAGLSNAELIVRAVRAYRIKK